ncbi:MAG: ABC transporter substrate-binding protein [Treponema sp.]|nr:ABC transporter substrate-binding protein [Treponema sp.]
MKKITLLLIILILLSSLISCNKKKESDNSSQKYIASTSWTAAFADLAGLDKVDAIAPASLRHPPEYEVTLSDIEIIKNSEYFIFAGFERMMQTLGTAIDGVNMVKITCDNSIQTVKKSAFQIAEVTGTQEECQKRVEEYISTILEGKKKLEEMGLAGAKVYCNKNQIYLARDLGLEVVEIFGPGPVTSQQILTAKEGDFDFIIDNVHNPVAGPLTEVSSAKYIIWRNFPEVIERNALKNVVAKNIAEITE